MNLNRPTVIFHPGIGKTATSAIQKIGFDLPTNLPNKVCFSPYGAFGGAHNLFSSNHPNFSFDKYESELAKTIEFTKGRTANTVISSEFMIHLNYPAILDLLGRFQQNNINIKVVFGIREYTGYLMSAYMQGIKVKFGMKPGENLNQFCTRSIETIRYPQLVDRWAKVVGDNQIYLIDFDAKRDLFVEEFFAFIGHKLKNYQPEIVNSSLSIESAQILHAFDRVSHDIQARKKVVDVLKQTKYNEQSKANALKVAESIVLGKYEHDKERLTSRYQWV